MKEIKELEEKLLKCEKHNRQLRMDAVLLRLRTEANKENPKVRHLYDLVKELADIKMETEHA